MTTDLAAEHHAANEWLNDIEEALTSAISEGDLLLNGDASAEPDLDSGPDYLAGLEDAETRQRVKNIQDVLKRCLSIAEFLFLDA